MNKEERNMKKLLAMVLAFCLMLGMLPLGAAAASAEIASGKCGTNLEWVLTEDGTLTISGTGDMNSYSYNNIPWSRYTANITRVVVQEGVTSLSDYAFLNCTKLADIDLPDSLKSIGVVALAYTALEIIEIPAGVTSIGPEAFENNSNLTSFRVAAGNTAYSADSAGVLFNKNKTQLIRCPLAIQGKYTIPSTVTLVGEKAFVMCMGLTEVTIPGSVKELSRHAFFACTALKTVHLQEGLEIIGKESFANCSALSGSLTIPASVKKVDSSPFMGTELSEVWFLGDMPEISLYAFSANALTVYYPAGNATWTEEKIEAVKGLSTWVAVASKLTLKASNVASSGKIHLTWNSMPDAVKYEVYRATSKSGTYTILSTVTGTSLTNTSTTAGKTYYYKVRFVDANGNKSDFSDVVSRTCDLPQPKITLSNVASTGKIKISWEKIDGATKYEVYRSKDNKTWSLLKSTTSTSLTNTSATAGTTYYYKVKAIASSSAANSAYSTVKSRTCDLAQPTISSLTITASTGKIKIKWGAVEGATKYELYCSTDNQTWKKLTATTGTSINHNSAVAGTKYYYKVRAISSNSAANSAYSAVKYGTCDLARPTLTVKLNTSGKPYLSWTKIEGAVKYEIYRSTDNKTWSLLKTTTGTKLTNTSTVAGTTYYYKVRAIASNTAANSAYSTVISIKAG